MIFAVLTSRLQCFAVAVGGGGGGFTKVARSSPHLAFAVFERLMELSCDAIG